MRINSRQLGALVGLVALPALAAGPSITLVTGPQPAPLEQLAAGEIATRFKELFDATVRTVSTFESAEHVVLIGNPETNPAIRKLAGGAWPGLGDQGHALKSITTPRGTVLVVGGGSPVATYWAAAELGHHFGVRRLMHADFPPLHPPAFSLAGINVVLEPALKIRAWHTLGTSPASSVSWSLAEHRNRLRQLAKLKFNHLVITVQPWQPFAPFEVDGGAKPTGALWRGPELRVDGETAGRAAFGGDDIFRNPDFKHATTDAQRVEAGVKLVRGIIAEARSLGMTVALGIDAGAGAARELSAAQRLAGQKTYPLADSFLLWPGNTSAGTVTIQHADQRAGSCRWIELGNSRGNVLPLFDLGRLHESIQQIRRGPGDGFVAGCQLPDDLNTSVHYLSRAGFDPGMTPARALSDLVTPICGAGVGERVAIGFDELAKAAELVARNDPEIASPQAGVILRHHRAAGPVPAWWAGAKNGFALAMNEMYRANTRARGGAREFSLHLAKRFEFGLHYFSCLESVRAAGMAKAARDQGAQLEHLDKAVEAMHNALAALADVPRGNADRGVIALLNEHGYRPLLRELERADP